MTDIGCKVEDVSTPCFLVDLDKVKGNIARMQGVADKYKVKVRPHMKTAKTLEAGELMTGGKKRSIVVSTVQEAEFYADGGFDDILLGAMCTKEKLPRLKAIAEKIQEFHVFIDNQYFIDLLSSNPPKGKQWSVFLKVDTGNKRAGVLWDSDDAVALVQSVQKSANIKFQGLYAHEGHAYNHVGQQAVARVCNDSAVKVNDLASRLEAAGLPCPTKAIGSTPIAALPGDRMQLLNEIHPGNYVFYDVQQSLIASCKIEDIAGKVATRVIGHYPERDQLLVDCGWTAISLDGQDKIPYGQGKASYCLVEDNPNLVLVKMTQEVGVIESRRGPLRYEKYPIGSLLYFYPYHSCATACMHREYIVHQGDTVVAKWKPCSGW